MILSSWEILLFGAIILVLIIVVAIYKTTND